MKAVRARKPIASKTSRASSRRFPIVGIGASAGGLEAFTQLIAALPADSGMAFVLLQHLDPNHTSGLAETIAKSTTMPVAQMNARTRIEANHVYVMPPNADITVSDGVVNLAERGLDRSQPHLPIDVFFRSLADDRGSGGVGVVLSGTGADGTEGLRAIKAAGGITLAQDPKTAKFDGMPLSAVAAGVVDHVLPLPELAHEIVRLSGHPYVADPGSPEPSDRDPVLETIVALVRRTHGTDFSEYKSPTFQRRLARRMALRHIATSDAYLELLEKEPAEIERLHEDVLIHVTSFFRDPDVFERLKTAVFPEIFKTKSAGDPIRLWIAGCATGEEAYALAIALFEAMDAASIHHPIQVFGTDVSERVITKARLGIFAESAMKDVSEERRRRYFTKVDAGYRINKSVRDACVFVRHDLGQDPPFSKLDFISCRNVLIYFDQTLQKRVVPIFHYALKRGGFLLLGSSENIPGFAQLFTPFDKAHKIFARTPAASALRFAPRAESHPSDAATMSMGAVAASRRTGDVAKHLDRLLLARYAPAGILINDRMQILQYRGDLGPFLRPAPGEPQSTVTKMARPGLAAVIRSGVRDAKKSASAVTIAGVEASGSVSSDTCDVTILPFNVAAEDRNQCFVVLFEKPVRVARAKAPAKESTANAQHVRRLEHELAASEEYLQSLIDDHDHANEELNAANEELVAGNEELQSLNEELETAKEELQSTNEELVTVNDELQFRNHEVTEVNSDLVNILSTVDVPILILDAERRIRRFTPKAKVLLNIRATDIGRSFDDIKASLPVQGVDAVIAEVIESNTMHESEVQDRDGRWYRMQIRPYRTIDNRIEGVTLSLVDIDALKKSIGEADRASAAKDEFLAMLSHEMRTPLFSILMQAELLRSGYTDTDKVRSAGEAIERGTRTQMKLIDDLLDVSRIVAGKLKLELKPTQLTHVIEAAIADISASAECKGVKIVVAHASPLDTVLGDAARLQQVVGNLLSNAVKFTAAKGSITCRLTAEDGRARIDIIDTGSGIDPAFVAHVFKRFAQEDGSSIRKHGGLGLGLAIVRHLVEAHSGSVRAASDGKGRGATFSVELPLLDEPAEALARRDRRQVRRESVKGFAEARSERQLEGLRVLIVDDDRAARDVMGEMLTQMGAEVRLTKSVDEAMAAVDDFEPEMMLSDIAMPGADGYDLIRRLRSRGTKRGGSIPVLALTAFAGEETSARALEAGFDMHLAKPVGIDELAQAVARLLRRRVRPAS